MNPNFTKYSYREFLERKLLLLNFNLKSALELHEIKKTCKNVKEFTSNVTVIKYIKVCQEAAELNFSVPGFLDDQAMNWIGYISYFFNHATISDELNATRFLTFDNYFKKWIKILGIEKESIIKTLAVPGKLMPPKFLWKEISSLGVVPAVDFNETYQLDVAETFIGGFRVFTKHFCEHIENMVVEKKNTIIDSTFDNVDSLINYEKQSDILRFVHLFTEYFRLKKWFEVSRHSRVPSELSNIFSGKVSLVRFLENLLEKYSWLLKILQKSILDLFEFCKNLFCNKFKLNSEIEHISFNIFDYIENDDVLVKKILKLSKQDYVFFTHIPRELLIIFAIYEIKLNDNFLLMKNDSDLTEIAIQINLVFTQMQTLCNFLAELLYCSKLLENDDLFFSINPFTGFFSLTKLGIPVNSLLPYEALVFSLESKKPKESIFFICEEEPELTEIYSKPLDIIEEVVFEEHRDVFKKYFNRLEKKPNIRKDVAFFVDNFQVESLNSPKKSLKKKEKKPT